MKPDWSVRRYLVLILAMSVALRVAAAFALGNQVDILPGTYDQVSYHNLAIRILGGHGFTFDTFWWPATPAGEQTAHWSYLYTFYLVAIYALFGPNPLIARLIQAVIVGILHPWLAYRIGERVFNRTIGLVSAGITAIYIYFIYYSGTLMTEPFYITAILGSLYLAILLAAERETTRFGDLWLGLLLGLSMGAAILFRQLFMLIVPFLMLWIGYARWRRNHNFPAAALAVSLAVVGLLILPFTLFNYSRFDRFVLLNTNAGFAFFWGNHPIHGTNFYAILPPDKPSYQQLIPKELRSLDEAALDQALLKAGLGFVWEDPGRYILLSINRLKDYFVFWPTPDSSLFSNIGRLFSFTLFLPFMIFGILQVLFNRKQAYVINLASPIMLLLLYAALYTGVHLLTWTLIRYRLPVDAVLIVFAGLALTQLAGRLHTMRQRSKSPTARRENKPAAP